MRVIAIIQARLGSTRLPGKVLMPIRADAREGVLGEPMLSHVVCRAQHIQGVDRVVVATDKESHERIFRANVIWPGDLYWGPDEPLARYVEVVERLGLWEEDYVVRITGDCPGLDPEVSGAVVKLALEGDFPYASNLKYWPDGLDTEVIRVSMLLNAHFDAYGPGGALSSASYTREHVTPWIREKVSSWGNSGAMELGKGPGRGYKWSVDTEEDLEYVRELYSVLGRNWGWKEALGVKPGDLCPLCANRVPHTQRSLTSIGGVRDYTVYDLHDTEVSGGVAPQECIAWQLVKRGHPHKIPPSPTASQGE